MSDLNNVVVTSIDYYDIRFPTSLDPDGPSNAFNRPDYSSAYLVLNTSVLRLKVHGMTFTCGQGTDIVLAAMRAYEPLIVKRSLGEIVNNMNAFYYQLSNHPLLGFLGAEKGIMQKAVCAIINAVWDCWARAENKPLWRHILDLPTDLLLKAIPFKYIDDVVDEKYARELIDSNRKTALQRAEDLACNGLAAYNTSVGWMKHSTEKMIDLVRKSRSDGFTAFKLKIGSDLDKDMEKAQALREEIGPDGIMMFDANGIWNVETAIEWSLKLSKYRPLYIEEPTAADDVLGHTRIAQALAPHGVKVAGGEQCPNRILFKQFLASDAMQICQVDPTRVGGVSECLAVLLLAAHYRVPVCPHGGGVGLCPMAQHIAAVNYLLFSPSRDGILLEYVDRLHEFLDPLLDVREGRYFVPQDAPGYVKFTEEAIEKYPFPDGEVWRDLIASGRHKGY